MKKLISILLIAVLAFSFTACGSSNSDGQEMPSSNAASADKALVVYYSATGNTEAAAKAIADISGADILEITPARPYTDEDLDYTDDNSRVSLEYNDESKRDVALATATPDNWENYDTVFIGYPIWWGVSAWPVDSFVKSNDFSGKTVIPFCTSASSDIGQSDSLLAEAAGTGSWQEGKRFSSNVSSDEITEWLNEIIK